MYDFVRTVDKSKNGAILRCECKNRHTGEIELLSSQQVREARRNGAKFIGLEIRSGRVFAPKEQRVRLAVDAPSNSLQGTAQGYEIVLDGYLESLVRQSERYSRRLFVAQLGAAMAHVSFGRVVCLSGIRRSGKTIGLLQSISALVASGVLISEIALITVKNERATITDLETACKQLCDTGKKFIFIDEITLVQDFLSDAAFFADVLSARAKVILSGTQSYVWAQAVLGTLYGRVAMIKVTMPTLDEYIRLFPDRVASKNKSVILRDFIRYNGVLVKDEYDGMRMAHSSLQSAVIDNIVSTVERNRSYSSFSSTAKSLYSMGRTLLPLVLYKTLFIATQTLNRSAQGIAKLKLSDKAVLLYNEALPGTISDESAKMLKSRIDNVKDEQLAAMIGALSNIGVVTVVRNVVELDDDYAVFSKNRTELCTPMSSLLFSILATQSKYAASGELEGVLFENAVLSHTYHVGEARDLDVRFFRCSLTGSGKKRFNVVNETPEVAVVVQTKPDPLSDSGVRSLLIEVKRDFRHSSEHERNLRSSSVEHYVKNIVDRVVVYSGDAYTTSDGLVRYVNIYDFLLDVEGQLIRLLS